VPPKENPQPEIKPEQNSTPAAEKVANPNVSQNPTPLTTAKKPVLRTATPSISQHLNTEKKTDNNTDQNAAPSADMPKNSFTQDQLEKAWEKYANELKTRKAGLGAALLSRKPVLGPEHVIEFSISNKALEEAINEDKMNFLGFLRKELGNYSLQLNLLMVEVDEKANLYTANDRYKRLAEKNPAINRFRQAFDLDIEF
jgi:DNA polymerase-3 subunit gamma/tau